MTTPLHELAAWLEEHAPGCSLASVTIHVAVPEGREQQVVRRLRFLLPSFVTITTEPSGGLLVLGVTPLGSPIGTAFSPKGD